MNNDQIKEKIQSTSNKIFKYEYLLQMHLSCGAKFFMLNHG